MDINIKKVLHITLLLTFSGCSYSDNKVSESPFDLMREGYATMAFLSSVDSKILSGSDIKSFSKELEKINFVKVTKGKILIGNDSSTKAANYHYYINPNSSESISIQQTNEQHKLSENWKNIRSLIGMYSGIRNDNGLYYLKLTSGYKASLSATFRTTNHIINIRSELSYELDGINSMSIEQKAEFVEANNKLNNILEILTKYLVTQSELIYKPLYGRVLTSEERLYGFISFWSEVKYNFAFFDQVPELNWDELLIEYLPKIKEDQSNQQYYKLMQRICAKLKDGHTNIYLPFELKMEIAKPPLEFRSIGEKIYIINADKSLEGVVPLGSSLIAVDGFPVWEYLEEKIYPFISSSTDHIKRRIACARILEGDINTGVSIEFESPAGEKKKMELERSNGSISWIRSSPQRKLLEYKRLNDSISYISINRFNTSKIVDEFKTYVDSIRNTSYLILDLRKNGGGNSSYGYEILKYFTKEPFLTSKWKTREHKAAFKAWGSSINKKKNDLSEWEREAKLTFDGDYWFTAAPDTIQPSSNNYIDIPCVILIGNETASAAEDFLVAAESIPFGVTIGDKTYGSTGQPLHLRLPGGGSARICTKRDTYPDGREFVGYGVIPDYFVKESLEDILNNRDAVLDFALGYFDR